MKNINLFGVALLASALVACGGSSSSDTSSSSANSSFSQSSQSSAMSSSESSSGTDVSSSSESSASSVQSSGATSSSSADSSSSAPAQPDPSVMVDKTWGNFPEAQYLSILESVAGTSNNPVLETVEPLAIEGLLFHRIGADVSLRHRGGSNSEFNFNGSSWVEGNSVIAPAMGAQAPELRAYIAVPVEQGRALTLSVTHRNTSSNPGNPKIVFVGSDGLILDSGNAAPNTATITTLTIPSGHMQTHVKIAYSREGAETGGMHFSALSRVYDEPSQHTSSSAADSSASSGANSSQQGNNSSSHSSSSEQSSSAGGSTPPNMGEDGMLSCEQANTVQGFAALGNGTTGGAGGTYVIAKTGADIVAALATKKNNPTPLTIYINGTITPENSGTNQFDVKDMANVSIIGVGNAGLFDGIGINIVRANNVIVRNLTLRYVRIGQKDAISLDGTSTNVWIDHNELYNSLEVGKDYYDELVSGKGNIDNITLSYNYLHDSWKTSLWGSGDSNNFHRRISFIGNRWERVNSRLPLFRFGEGHVVNNYYKDVLGTAINSRMGAVIRVENNHFENVQNALISMDSSAMGFWNPSGNIIQNVTWSSFPSNCTSSKHCNWGGTPGTVQNGGEFTAIGSHSTVHLSDYEPPYSMSVLPGSEVKEHVIKNAGVNKISRECLGVPEYIIEGESGGGIVPDDNGGSVGGEDGTGTEAGIAEGGWSVEALKMGAGVVVSGGVTSSSETDVAFNITGGKMQSGAEAFFFVSKIVEGDFVFTVNFTSMANALRTNNAEGQAGIVVCGGACENGSSVVSANVKLGITDSSGPKLIDTRRLADGASRSNSINTNVSLVPSEQLYLRITREGDSTTSSYSIDGGVSYQVVRTNTFTNGLDDKLKIGLFASQGNTSGSDQTNSFVFEHILIETD